MASQSGKQGKTGGGTQSSLLNHFVLRTIKPKQDAVATVASSTTTTTSTTTVTDGGNSISSSQDKKRPPPHPIMMVSGGHNGDRYTGDRRTNKQKRRTDEALKRRAVAVTHTKRRRRSLPAAADGGGPRKPAPPPVAPGAHASTRCVYCTADARAGGGDGDGGSPAALVVLPKPRPTVGLQTQDDEQHRRKPLCLLHYYTTRYSRVHAADRVKPIGDGKEMERQLPFVRELFKEAFLEVQREVREESARSWKRNRKDPLKGLLGFGTSAGGKKKKKKKKDKDKKPTMSTSTINSKAEEEEEEGGFLKQVQPREKALITEQRHRIERAANESHRAVTEPPPPDTGTTSTPTATKPKAGKKTLRRTVRRSVATSTPTSAAARKTADGGKGNIYRRRKATGNIWSTVLNPKAKPERDGESGADGEKIDWNRGVTCGRCRSNDVHTLGNVVGRNNDASKADIWGMARENDASTRYECRKCGLKWNEDD